MVDKSLSPNYLLGLAPFFPSVYAGEEDMRFNYAAINDAAGAVAPAYHCPQYEGQHTADSSSNFMNKMLEQHDEFLRMEEQQCKMGCDHDDDQRPADLQSNHKPNEKLTSLLQGSVDNSINDQLQLHAGTYDSYIAGDQALLHVPLKVEPMATLIQSPVDKSTSSYTDSDYTATFRKRKLPHNKYCTSSREVEIADTQQTSDGEVGSHAVLYSLPKRGKQLAAYANFLAEERHWTVAIAGADDQEDDDVDNEYIAVQHREEKAMKMDTGSWSLESMMGSSSPDQVISTPPTASSGLRSEAVEAGNADRAMKAAELRNASMKQDKGARTSPAVNKEASNVQSKLWRRASLMEYMRPAQIHKHLQLLNPNYLQGPDNNTRNRIADGHLCSVCEREPTDGQIILCRPCFLLAWRQNKDIVDVGTSGSLRLRISPRSIPTSSYLKTCKLPNEDSLCELAEEVNEPWVQCDHCDKWQHHICVLFNPYLNKHNIKYYCPMCCLKKRSKELHGESTAIRNDINLGAAQWRARSLPSTSLSDHIESRLYSQLRKERAEREGYQGFAVSSQEVESLKGLVVCVVETTDKVLSLNPRISEVIKTQMDNPFCFCHVSQMVMLFQDIGGVDVCLFVMYVQEYGNNECQGHPNHKFVYIAYLDFVKYFEPANARIVHNEALWTFVYHQILIGYLEKCKLRGFNACYIWSSPPKKGDSYILNCHPSSQLIPQPQKLCKWYLSMAEKAKREGVVSRYMSLFEHLFGRGLAGPNILELPSFDGDFVPHSIVGIIAGHYSNSNRTIRLDELMAEVIANKARYLDN
ncbi:hypothetical protein L7F22_041633 [Adiantum nelumboides]|nr:hypothetical protein [Adiantum nelumboides]